MCELGGARLGEDLGVAGEDDPGQESNQRPVGDDEEHLAQQEQGGHLAHVRFHVLEKKLKNKGIYGTTVVAQRNGR